ncbi:MAG TPA: hypothetical protein VJQ54_22215 [Candidatus Sulfotelmatobacter sp.]|nr:hypothetical protein [Candidatus Sulfotelmatobacter sp.]
MEILYGNVLAYAPAEAAAESLLSYCGDISGICFIHRDDSVTAKEFAHPDQAKIS